jgi:hypothetical protein
MSKLKSQMSKMKIKGQKLKKTSYDTDITIIFVLLLICVPVNINLPLRDFIVRVVLALHWLSRQPYFEQ